MARPYREILEDSKVRTALQQAWDDSEPGISGGHEEGGFIVKNLAGELSVLRWEKGSQNRIILPPHPHCRIGEYAIVASFHTHPNTGDNYLQEQ